MNYSLPLATSNPVESAAFFPQILGWTNLILQKKALKDQIFFSQILNWTISLQILPIKDQIQL